jgi:hypothetical protein
MRMVSLSRERSFSIGSESRLGGWRDCWNGGTQVSDFEWDTEPGHDNYFTEIYAVDLENRKRLAATLASFCFPSLLRHSQMRIVMETTHTDVLFPHQPRSRQRCPGLSGSPLAG